MTKTTPLEAIKKECQECLQTVRPVPCGAIGCPLYRYRFGVDHTPDAGRFEPTSAISTFCIDCVGGPENVKDIETCTGKLFSKRTCALHGHKGRQLKAVIKSMKTKNPITDD